MPKKPGHKSTKIKVPLGGVAIARFFMPWEENSYMKRECMILGCEHRLKDCEVPHQGPGLGVDDAQLDRDLKDGTDRTVTGGVCACCVAKILA